MVDCVWRSDNAAEIKFETSALTSTEISGMTKHVCCRWDFHRVDTLTCFCKSPLPGNFSDPLCSIKGCLPIFLPLLSSCIKEEMWLCWKQRSHFLKALLVVWITPTSATFAFVLRVAVIKPAKRKLISISLIAFHMIFIKSSSRDFFVNTALTEKLFSHYTSQAETCQEKKSPWNGIICFKMTVLLVSQLIFLPVYFSSRVFLNCFAFHIWPVLSSSCRPFVEHSEVSQLWLRNNKTTLKWWIKDCNKEASHTRWETSPRTCPGGSLWCEGAVALLFSLSGAASALKATWWPDGDILRLHASHKK